MDAKCTECGSSDIFANDSGSFDLLPKWTVFNPPPKGFIGLFAGIKLEVV